MQCDLCDGVYPDDEMESTKDGRAWVCSDCRSDSLQRVTDWR